jgi:hypothetical protein
MAILPPKKPRNFLANKSILEQIALSKLSYCSFLEPEHAVFTKSIEVDKGNPILAALKKVEAELGTIVRVETLEHIPLSTEKRKAGRSKNPEYEKCNFPPFQHWMLTEEGWVCVGKSHWNGGLGNGHFDTQHGKLTDTHVLMLMAMVDRFARKGSWRGYSYRDEMEGAAIINLLEAALQFNETKSINPFAYYTSCMTNVFRKVLASEKKHAAIRDDLLIASGQSPSMGRQMEHELAKFEPVKLQGKRGRPKTIK